jgi:hypothetical protein
LILSSVLRSAGGGIGARGPNLQQQAATAVGATDTPPTPVKVQPAMEQRICGMLCTQKVFI